MRILLDQGTHDLRNTGNNAMLQVMVFRLQKLWPDALLEVVTASPHLLKLYCPNAYPVSKDGLKDWSKNRAWLDLLHQLIPKLLLRLLLEFREEIWRRWPALTPIRISMKISSIIQFGKKQLKPDNAVARKESNYEAKSNETLRRSIDNYDLVIAVGGGTISDPIKDCAIPVLDRLEVAAQLGKVTAMLGQGMGPIQDPELRARANTVLPLVDLIAIREDTFTPQLLTLSGVDLNRVIFTGDDAIEMAYRAQNNKKGTRIGVSMRKAVYAEVSDHHIVAVRTVLQQAAVKYETSLIPIPISFGSNEWDARVIQELLAGQAHILNTIQRFDTPEEIIKRVGKCRLVVTGTYHAAVFALAQGIPAIGLAKSAHYTYKLMGLADQFYPVFKVIKLDDEHIIEKLTEAIDIAWQSADQVKPQLLDIAARQVELGYTAYRHVYELVLAMNSAKNTG